MGGFMQVTDGIFTIPNLLSEQECQDWIALSESRGFEPAPVESLSGPRRHEEIRNNDRVILDDVERASELWQRVSDGVPQVLSGWTAVGLNERLRVYRYDRGQRFRWHGDGCFRRPNGEQSLLTFMVYLNEGFLGGETVFQATRIEPRRGMALLFLHWLKHMGAEVHEGRKYVLRSDVMFEKTRR